ncbi:MAG: hypothetical protein ABGX16_12525 [Pirellulales bacterium]
MLVAGNRQSCDFLIQRFFRGEMNENHLKSVPLPLLNATLKQLGRSVDLTVARVDCFSAGLFFDADYFNIPEWVGTNLRLPKKSAGLFKVNRSLKSDFNKIQNEGLSHTISHDVSELDLVGIRIPIIERWPCCNT